jgi:hypothetical protein
MPLSTRKRACLSIDKQRFFLPANQSACTCARLRRNMRWRPRCAERSARHAPGNDCVGGAHARAHGTAIVAGNGQHLSWADHRQDFEHMMPLDPDHARCRAMRRAAEARPVTRQIERAIGDAEMLPHPPATPGVGTAVGARSRNVTHAMHVLPNVSDMMLGVVMAMMMTWPCVGRRCGPCECANRDQYCHGFLHALVGPSAVELENAGGRARRSQCSLVKPLLWVKRVESCDLAQRFPFKGARCLSRRREHGMEGSRRRRYELRAVAGFDAEMRLCRRRSENIITLHHALSAPGFSPSIFAVPRVRTSQPPNPGGVINQCSRARIAIRTESSYALHHARPPAQPEVTRAAALSFIRARCCRVGKPVWIAAPKCKSRIPRTKRATSLFAPQLGLRCRIAGCNAT